MLKAPPILIALCGIFVTFFTGPGTSPLFAAEIKVGDRVTVTAEKTDLKAGKQVVAVVRRGQQCTVEKVNGSWLLTTVTIDGKTHRGWMQQDSVAPVTPTPDPAPSAGSILKQLGTLHGHSDDVYCIAFAADGKTVVSGGGDHTIVVWDVGNYKPVAVLTGHKRRIRCLQFSPVMDVILASGGGEVSDGELKLWNLKEQRLVADLPVGKTEVMSLGFSADGTRLFTAGWSQFVSIWDVITTRRRGNVRTSFGDIVSFVAVSPHDETIAVDGKQGLVFLQDTEKILDVDNPTEATRHVLADHKQNISALGFSADGRFLATGSEDQRCVVWDVQTGKRVQEIDTQNGPVTAVGLSPDGKWLVTANRMTDAPLKIWDAARGHLLAEVDAGKVLAVAFSPAGRLLATSDGADVRLWSLQPPTGLKLR